MFVQAGGEIFLGGGDGFQVVAALKLLHHARREEGGQGRAEPDVPDAQSQQGDQDADGLLLEPAEHQRERQVVDAALERIGQRQRDLNGAVCVVCLLYTSDAADEL